MIRKRAVAIAIILAGGVAGAAAAQPAPLPKVVQPPPAATPAPSVAQAIVLPAGTGSMVQLPKPATTVLAADPNVARVQPASPTALFIVGVAPGKTTIMATAAGGKLVRQFDVTVIPGATPPPASTMPPVLNLGAPAGPAVQKLTAADAAKAESAIHQVLPAAERVRARAEGTNLVLTGLVATPEIAQQAVAIARGFAGPTNVMNNLMVLSSVQVNLRVRICEVDRTVMRQLGINWQALGSFKFSLFGTPFSGALSAIVPAAVGATSAAYSLGGSLASHNVDVDGVIDALATDNLATLLAEPNLTALSGQTASFLAGGEFPIPVAASNSGGSNTITVAFKQYGVSLSFVPTVLGPDSINLKVEPEVSSLTTQGAVSVPIVGGGTLTIPALTVRRANTTIELGSGQSFAIAGLLEHTSNQTLQTLPGIGELPILGALFRSTQFQNDESELVIIVTPYLVKPAASPAQLAAPTDGFHPATDLDRILFGRTVASTPGGHRIDAGFVVE